MGFRRSPAVEQSHSFISLWRRKGNQKHSRLFICYQSAYLSRSTHSHILPLFGQICIFAESYHLPAGCSTSDRTDLNQRFLIAVKENNKTELLISSLCKCDILLDLLFFYLNEFEEKCLTLLVGTREITGLL